MKIIELKNITKIYGSGEAKVNALNGINLTINKGDFVAIMGASGCGKSTLLSILGCMDTYTNGEYFLNNKSINKENINKLSNIRNKEISFIFQNFALIREYTVFENIELPLKIRKLDRNKINTKVMQAMENMGIVHLKDKLISNISGGEQQRTALARALVQDSSIILADEPTGSLDYENGLKIMNLFKLLNEKYNKTIILVTHDENVANQAKQLIKMKDGKIIKNIMV
ncbi:ABC transporter ATP-binding protein [Clostridium perfringens]|uniref:Putative ABC transporter ATPase n=1 Tax=Clostridium perfringens TaxID=1502 RepID=X5I2D0_CLOPF|nr:ABC transporter ATP-binding protein [Clostridium perfringens]EJT6172301.1 ABC transporter ATP-binding protein [Clostridium perfringens]EJT6543011.1 ABC transporter ATP-binding protein [Clostridium perfringens]EJT6568032.1 ABC transporter ATP-binding protein [Clostridium perfringens]MBS5995774.1 ABC transporter ATP-binding protein [Clostridium perfringens]MDM0998733.1 ABC transporter ATP-binding protein [Clostridium perfringens]